MLTEQSKKPWASFCISTYKRPEFLRAQLNLLAKQTFQNFEVIISDNDPEQSADVVVSNMNDLRFKYFSNIENLGMVKSFNESIKRSQGKFIVMVTDDDPVNPEMLTDFHNIIIKYPGYAIYCGCNRNNKEKMAIEVFKKDEFTFQLLHPKLTSNFLWSSCILEKETVMSLGRMPDYGSPHFADHALLALCSKENGGVFVNKLYSNLTSHNQNFSKANFDLYFVGCVQFYNLIKKSFDENFYIKRRENALLKHLEKWFIDNSFSLRKYYTIKNKNLQKVKEVSAFSKKILQLKFMRPILFRYYLKLSVFHLKKSLYLSRHTT